MKKPSYKCSQPDLYVACRFGWRLCRNNLAAFAAVKPKYTEAYINAQLAAVDAADLLPDANARYEDYDLVKQRYELAAKVAIGKFALLLGYIDDAYRPSERDIMYRSCGEPFYAKAKKGQWAHVSALMSTAVPFMDKNKAALETTWQDPSVKNNMPASFITDFKAIQAELIGLNDDRDNTDETAMNQTSEKLDANNAIHSAVLEMCTDAARIFSLTPTLKEEFTFTNFLNKTRGIRPAGINGKVSNAVTGKVLENVTVFIADSDRVATTDDKGRYEISPLMYGKYTVSFEAEGYEPFVVVDVAVKTGVLTRVNIMLTPILVAV